MVIPPWVALLALTTNCLKNNSIGPTDMMVEAGLTSPLKESLILKRGFIDLHRSRRVLLQPSNLTQS